MYRLLHRFIVVVVVMFISPALRIVAQDEAKPFRPAMTADELVVTPSPEVGTLPQVRQAEVDLSTGTAILSYPLLEWTVGSMPVRIGLHYRVGAFTTDELPGCVGLGWNLTGTGFVSRTIVGQPDELRTFDMRTSSDADTDYIERLLDYRADASLDRYSYSCPGASGQFVISGSEIVQIPKTNNRIELIGEVDRGVRDFRITTPDGTRYDFTRREHINYRQKPYCIEYGWKSPDYTAVSAWHLTEVILPEGADTIRYEYTSVPMWSRWHYRPTDNITVRDDPWSTQGVWWLFQGVYDETVNINDTQFEDQCIPLRIVSRTGSVEFSHDRTSPHRIFISGMTLFDHAGKAVRTVTLESDGKELRKLTGITVSGADGSLIDEQRFLYHEIPVHHYGDIFNYPNVSSSAPHTITTALHPQTLTLNPRRKPDFTYAVSNSLRQTVSATGVVTDYVYEPNAIRMVKPSPRRTSSRDLTFVDSLSGTHRPVFPLEDPDSLPSVDAGQPDSMITIGIRLKSIVQTDRPTGRRITREYDYADGICNIDIMSVTCSDFIAMSGMKWFYMPSDSQILIITVYDTSSTLLFGSRMPGVPVENARIFYGKVTETVSGTGLDQPLRTLYEFDTSRCMLTRIYGGREMADIDNTDDRRTLNTRVPVNSTDAQMKRMESHIVRGYFREHVGATPEFVGRTAYQWVNGEYRPFESERRHYFTADSMCMQVGLHYEQLVHDVRKFPQEVLIHDFKSMDDVSCFDISLEASLRLLDSVAVTRHFPDGSVRQRTSRQHYTGIRFGNGASSVPGGGVLIPLDSVALLDSAVRIKSSAPWQTDTLRRIPDIILPIGETIREGRHTMEHHTAFSSMVDSDGFLRTVADSLRLLTLPVREMWIMDGCDTLHRSYAYARFPGAGGTSLTLPVSVTTHVSGAAEPIDVQRIHDYTPYGRPLLVTQTGRQPVEYEWSDGGGDLVKSLTLLERGAVYGHSVPVLTTEFKWQPLVGCTSIRTPSGKTTRYSYKADRLHQVTDGEGRLLVEHDYEMYADSKANFNGRNRISTTSYLLDSGQGATSTGLFDGYSLPVAEIAESAGGSGEDIAMLSRYDALGRPVARWMPMALDGDAVARAVKNDQTLYQAAVEQFADAEALSRITYSGRPDRMPASATLGGSDFAAHPQLTTLTCSSPAHDARKVVRWSWDGSMLRADGYYAAGELDGVLTEDGDGRRTWVFTDCMGRQVLQRSAIGDAGRYADTYTVSDCWGNPLLVLPPEASARLGRSGSLTLGADAVADIIDRYAYVYGYDTRLRLRSKKLPGCAPVRYAYDTEGRVIYTRDGNQAQSGLRTFMLYDHLGRLVLTGICRDASYESFWDISSGDLPAMSFDTSDAVTDLKRLSQSAPHLYADACLLTATYYDDYRFLTSSDRHARLASVRAPEAIDTPMGLPTGTLTTVLDPTGLSVISAHKTMLSVNYYDAEERVIATATASHRGDITSTATTYTRGGLPSSVTTTLSPSSAGDEASHTIATTAVYDSQGRVLSTRLSRNDAPPVTLASHTYDSRGHLQRTTLAGGMQRSHDYDLHGWLTKWQCPFVGQQLLYADGATPSFTGRISSKLTATAGHTDRYDYRYDPLGRLTAAAFSRLMPDGAADTRADFSTAYTYDLQGNILSLTRHGLIAPGVYGLVDDITATFSGNQLSALRDDAPSVLLESSLDLPEGSWADTDFDYDPNGNLTRDMSRGVAEVQYNVLNLPQHIDFETGGWIDYHYSGSGTKLAETVYDADGSLLVRRDYVGIFEFESDTLRRTLLPEGFITEADGIFHAFIPDHQGNIVGIYNSAADSLEQYTDYYPYGLPHATATAPQLNRRKYGAKELTTDLGLNLYDFAARWHNPAFPRFTSPDPLTETYTPISPYTYCASDPINFIDPSGMTFNTINLSEEELILWNETIAQLTESYSLFNAVYTFLDESSVDITIKFGIIIMDDNTKSSGRYNDNDKTLILSSENKHVDTGVLQICENTLFEETFHAFQNQNKSEYGTGNFNFEFEAKLFKYICQFQIGGGYSSKFGGLSEMCHNLSTEYYYGDIQNVYRQLYDDTSTFNRDYIIYANQFAIFCRDNKKGNAHYHTPTTRLPIGLQMIFKRAFNNK